MFGHIDIEKLNKPLASLLFILGARNINKSKALSGVSKLFKILSLVKYVGVFQFTAAHGSAYS